MWGLKKYSKRITLFIVISNGILIIFLISWLLAQYKVADRQLQKDVAADLLKTINQMLDSSPNSYISLTGTKAIKLKIPGMPLEKSKETKSLQNGDTTYIMGKELFVTFSDSMGLNNNVINTAGLNRKTLIDKQELSTYFNLDTALYRKLLWQNWQNKDLRYTLVYTIEEKDSSLIYPDHLLYGKHFGLRLENKSEIAFTAILPQITLALFLVLVTIFSFILLYRSYIQQQQINLLRTDFVNNISHELKTPISTVRVALEALQKYNRKDDPKLHDEYLQLMSLEMERLDNLIHQVLQHRSLNSSTNMLNFKTAHLCKLVTEVAERYSIKAKEKGVVIKVILPNTPVELKVDAEHIKTVIANLIENSMLYAGKHPEITVKLSLNKKQISLEVMDNGPGIDEKYLSQLFKPFFRVPGENKHNVKGYGLGLSYCKQIVEHHNGKISASNLPAGGCVIRITFNS